MESMFASPPGGMVAVTGGEGTSDPNHPRLYFANNPSTGWRLLVNGGFDDGLRGLTGQTWYFSSLTYNETLIIGSRGIQCRTRDGSSPLILMLNPYGGDVRLGPSNGSGTTTLYQITYMENRAVVRGGTSPGSCSLTVGGDYGLKLSGGGINVILKPEAGGWLKITNGNDSGRYHLRVGAIDANNYIRTSQYVEASVIVGTSVNGLRTGSSADYCDVKFAKNRAWLSYDLRVSATSNFAFSRSGVGLERVYAKSFLTQYSAPVSQPLAARAANGEPMLRAADDDGEAMTMTAVKEACDDCSDLHDFADRIGACSVREYLPGEAPPGETEAHCIDLARVTEALLMVAKGGP
jgi:hypothetical protein